MGVVSRSESEESESSHKRLALDRPRMWPGKKGAVCGEREVEGTAVASVAISDCCVRGPPSLWPLASEPAFTGGGRDGLISRCVDGAMVDVCLSDPALTHMATGGGGGRVASPRDSTSLLLAAPHLGPLLAGQRWCRFKMAD